MQGYELMLLFDQNVALVAGAHADWGKVLDFADYVDLPFNSEILS